MPSARSLYAYRRQIDALGRFVRAVVPASVPMVVAGDFNAGRRPDRRNYLITNAASWHGDIAPRVAMDSRMGRLGCTLAGSADLHFSFHRGRDWQFFAAGRSAALDFAGLSTLFGHDRHGAMLSDHVGYVAAYRFATHFAPHASIELAAR